MGFPEINNGKENPKIQPPQSGFITSWSG